jgi:hypothetical protein
LAEKNHFIRTDFPLKNNRLTKIYLTEIMSESLTEKRTQSQKKRKIKLGMVDTEGLPHALLKNQYLLMMLTLQVFSDLQVTRRI